MAYLIKKRDTPPESFHTYVMRFWHIASHPKVTYSEAVTEVVRDAYKDGEDLMLRRIRASLRNYPHAEGDIVVMGQVERIIKERLEKAQLKND